MITNPLTILARVLVIVTATALSQPLFAAEEGSKIAHTAVYPGFYGIGPFS